MATKERTYNDTEIADKLKDLPGWYFEDGWIRRVYKTDGWPTTLMLVNSIGYLSEARASRAPAPKISAKSLGDGGQADEMMEDMKGERSSGERRPAPAQEHPIERMVENED